MHAPPPSLWNQADCDGRYAARFKPVILLRGLNHALMSTGKPVDPAKGRTDSPAEISLKEGSASLACTMLDFVAANMSPEQYVPFAALHTF